MTATLGGDPAALAAALTQVGPGAGGPPLPPGPDHAGGMPPVPPGMPPMMPADAMGPPPPAGMMPPPPDAAGMPPLPMPPGPGMPPMMPPQGAGPMYPTADPAFMAEVLAQVMAAQAADQQKLAADQTAAFVGNPVMQALASGAPMGPGAGQDGQAIGAPSGDMPMPPPPAGL